MLYIFLPKVVRINLNSVYLLICVQMWLLSVKVRRVGVAPLPFQYLNSFLNHNKKAWGSFKDKSPCYSSSLTYTRPATTTPRSVSLSLSILLAILWISLSLSLSLFSKQAFQKWRQPETVY
jgi:hypothetical protein